MKKQERWHSVSLRQCCRQKFDRLCGQCKRREDIIWVATRDVPARFVEIVRPEIFQRYKDLKSQLNDVQFGCDGDLDPYICEVIRELEREMGDIYVDHPFGFRRGF